MKIQNRIEEKLREALEPAHLAVENESHMHAVPKGSETHFKVLVVSEAFSGLSRVERHRKVNGVLREELANGVHALSVRALTGAEWSAESTADFVSPPCLGGSKS